MPPETRRRAPDPRARASGACPFPGDRTTGRGSRGGHRSGVEHHVVLAGQVDVREEEHHSPAELVQEPPRVVPVQVLDQQVRQEDVPPSVPGLRRG